MHSILKGLCRSDCLVYPDDAIIFEPTLEEHRYKLTRFEGLKINPKKCKLLANKVTVLGHVVSHDGISTAPKKVKIVREWPIPPNISQLRSFLGTLGYYRHFVPKFAEITTPL